MRVPVARSARRTLAAALALAALALAPRPAAARMQATLEFGVGAAIPLTRYVDSGGPDGHNRIDNGVHAALNLAILFDNWQFRYAVSVLSLGHQDLLIPQGTFDQINQAARDLTGTDVLGARTSVGNVDDTLTFHTLTFGYRFYLLRGTWQPYIPVEIGAAIVQSDTLTRSLYGFTLGTGVGLDVHIWKFLYAGLGVRYNFCFTETDQTIAGLGFLASENIFESAAAMAHIISITAQLQGRY